MYVKQALAQMFNSKLLMELAVAVLLDVLDVF